VGSGERTVETRIATVSGSLFGLFDADPVLGRFFGDAEDRPPEGERVAVLSHGFWRSAFGASPDVLGRSLQVGDAPYVIVGVAPRGFAGFSEAEAPALFVPVTAWAHGMAPDYASHHGWTWLEVVVKRRHGVNVEAANADLTAALARSREEQRRVDAGLPAPDAARLRAEAGPVQPGRGPLAGPEAGVVLWVMALALVVLVAACTNVVNLLLARSTERRREVAVRLALGVSRVRLLRQLATEGGLIAALGGALGAVVGLWAARALGGLFLAGEVSAALAHPRSLLFAGATVPALVLATSLAPAVQAFRADASALLRHSSSGTHRSTVAGGLLIVQGTISVVLLVGAGLFVRSFLNARSLRLGYDVEAVLVADIRLRGVSLTEAEAADLVGRVVDAASVVPGVAAATPAVSVPFWSTEGRGAPYVEGRDSLGRFGRFVLQAGSQDYFRTMGTRIMRGRGFTAADDAGAPPVAVVTRDMADALWPGADALGREFRLGGVSAPLIRVVGIAEPMRGSGLLGAADLWYFLPFDQYTTHLGPPRGRVLVRADERADLVAEPLRRRLQQEMPGSAWASVTPLEDIVAPHRRAWRFGATMLAAFAALALALAAVGLYGMVAYAVALRRRELAVRVALGASAPSVVRQVATRGVGCAAAGLALGGLIVVLAGPRVEPLLFGVSPRDPLVFAAVAGTLALVTVLSLVGPSLRALRGDPSLALRGE
jgi:predicted permease